MSVKCSHDHNSLKDKNLIVGGMGKEYTMPDGSIAHHNPEYIKQISHLGKGKAEYLVVSYSIFRRRRT